MKETTATTHVHNIYTMPETFAVPHLSLIHIQIPFTPIHSSTFTLLKAHAPMLYISFTSFSPSLSRPRSTPLSHPINPTLYMYLERLLSTILSGCPKHFRIFVLTYSSYFFFSP